MASYTSRLQLRKPVEGELVDVDTDLGQNFDKIDQNLGAYVCTSTTRPNAPWPGQIIFETDTSRVFTWTGTAWTDLGLTPWINVTFLNGWTNFGRAEGLPNPAGTGWRSQVELAPVRYRRQGTRVEIAGSAKNTVGADGHVFTLQPEFRPQRTYADIVPANAGVAEIRVFGDGAVIVTNYYAGGSAQVVNFNFHFYIDA